MFSLSECRYYAPCGLCTFYNTECTKKRKKKLENDISCNDHSNSPEDVAIALIKSGELPPIDVVDEVN